MSTARRVQQTCCHLRLVSSSEGRPESQAPVRDAARPALVLLPSPTGQATASETVLSSAAGEHARRAARRAVLGKVARRYGPFVASLVVVTALLWAILPAWWSSAAWGMLAPYHLVLLLLAAVVVVMAGDYAVRLDRVQRQLAPSAPPPSPAELGRAF
jgi:hypothetical protein